MTESDLEMSDSNELPQKCRECARAKRSSIHSNCDICHELEFHEFVLCDLNRCIQEKASFQCHAFRPALKLVGPSEHGILDHDVDSSRILKKKQSMLFHSDKVKYERALAVQKLSRDPDSVILQLKYHFVWNVSYRMPVFAPANDFIGFVHDTFLGCSEAAGGFVHLLYLAPDHVHLYVESDGERSPEDMAHDIKQASANAILEQFTVVKDELGGNMDLWDLSYFVETIG
jgi:REP element-mobilizing transposase RayT